MEQRLGNAPQEILISQSQKTEQTQRWYDKMIKYWGCFALFISVIVSVIFLYRQPLFKWNATINNDLLGTYGDFIGGVLGTIFAFYGMILMIRTFQNQIEYNEKSQKTNDELLKATIESNEISQKQQRLQDIQIFDSQFRSFFDLYKSAVDDYNTCKGLDSNGTDALNEIVGELSHYIPKCGASYEKRLNEAVKYYESVYVTYSDKMSTHFRMLYQLMRFIGNAEYIEEDTRVDYAKAVRGNLSESELILLRYNCFCPFGRKMQQYVNEFNLLKHLPLMKLQEFRKWTDILGDSDYIHAVEIMFTSLRKVLSKLVINVDNNDINKKELRCGNNWNITMSYERSSKSLRINIINFKNVTERVVAKTDIEKAFEKLGLGNMEELFCDFFEELFLKSKFDLYNKYIQNRHRITSTDEGNPKIYFLLYSYYPIILSQQRILPPQIAEQEETNKKE